MDRRRFLKRMGIGGAAVGASILAGKALGKTEILDKATAPRDEKTLEKTPFKRYVAKGWKMNTRAWCARCGYVHIPGPLTICCANPLLQVGMPPSSCVILGEAGAQTLTESMGINNWGEDNWDFDVEWRHRAHKVGLSVPVTTLYEKKARWNW